MLREEAESEFSIMLLLLSFKKIDSLDLVIALYSLTTF